MNNHYSQLPTALTLDTNLSPRAFRVMCYLLSLPKGDIVSNTDVCKKFDICNDSIAKYWKELIKSGWITRYEQRVNGKFSSFEYKLNVSEKIKKQTKPKELNLHHAGDLEGVAYFRSVIDLSSTNKESLSDILTEIANIISNHPDVTKF